MHHGHENIMLEVDQDQAGLRLDRLLGQALPNMGLRGRRRLIETGKVVVNGQPRSAGYRVALGQKVAVDGACCPEEAHHPPGLRLVCLGERFAALHKPAGLHSESLSGGGQGVSAWLPHLLDGPDQPNQPNQPGQPGQPDQTDQTDQAGQADQARHPGWQDARLANRLDQPTSGLLLVVRDAGAAQEFRRLEDAGLVRKEYAALVHGRVDGPAVLRLALDTKDRKKTRPASRASRASGSSGSSWTGGTNEALGAWGETSDPLRWTEIEPLHYDPAANRTLLRAVIRKGARHQIRVHLALHGHAIVGDTLYGPPDEVDRLYLHHVRLDMPGFSAESPLDWA